MRKTKRNMKGVTLIALVVTVIVLIILSTVTLTAVLGEGGLIQKAKETAAMAKEAAENEAIAQNELVTEFEKMMNEENTPLVPDEPTKNKANAPKLVDGMTPIKFTEPTNTAKGEAVTTNSSDANWYNYDEKKWANAQTEDGSMWVWIPRFAYRINSSSQTTDVVFLINDTNNYYDENGVIQKAKRANSATDIIDTTTGYTVHPAFTNESSINYANGGWDKEITGLWVSKFEAGYASGNNSAPVVASNVKYTLASSWVRAKEAGTSSDSTQPARNWLEGIYGKYNSTTKKYEWLNGEVAIKYPVFQGTTYSMNYIEINDTFNITRALTNTGNIYGFTSYTADSHMMKNSEWGAISYLAKSKYGLGSTDITINNISLNSGNRQRTETAAKTGVDSVYAVTGCTTGSTSEGEKQTTIANINATTGNTAADGVYTWNQKSGQASSSTGTIYGVYDLSGGLWEQMPAYIANGNGSLKSYGASVSYDGDTLRTTSTKYTTVYPSNDSGITNYDTASQTNYPLNKYIYGDAVRETCSSKAGTNESGWNTSSWYSDYSCFPGCGSTFFYRGGGFWSGTHAGLFAFARDDGGSSYSHGFHAVVVPAA